LQIHLILNVSLRFKIKVNDFELHKDEKQVGFLLVMPIMPSVVNFLFLFIPITIMRIQRICRKTVVAHVEASNSGLHE
jgi:hypothetical protein